MASRPDQLWAGERTSGAKLELYKMYVGTAEKISDRRGNLNVWMLALVNAVIALDSVLVGEVAVRGGLLVPAAGIATCLVWAALLKSYRFLNAAKFRVIFELEKDLSIDLFQREDVHAKSLRRVTLSKLERYVPLAFLGLFIAIFAGRLVAVISAN